MSESAKTIGSFREVVQDLLVPELKALKVEVRALRDEMHTSNDALRQEMHSSHEALRQEMKLRYESLQQEIKLRHDSLEQTIRAGDERNETLIRNLSEKLDFAIDIRKRLANLEARLPKQ